MTLGRLVDTTWTAMFMFGAELFLACQGYAHIPIDRDALDRLKPDVNANGAIIPGSTDRSLLGKGYNLKKVIHLPPYEQVVSENVEFLREKAFHKIEEVEGKELDTYTATMETPQGDKLTMKLMEGKDFLMMSLKVFYSSEDKIVIILDNKADGEADCYQTNGERIFRILGGLSEHQSTYRIGHGMLYQFVTIRQDQLKNQ